MSRTTPNRIIPAPDITRLAKAIYGRELDELKQQVASLTGVLKARQAELVDLKRALRGALNDRDAKLQDLAGSRESNRKLRIENANLKCELRAIKERQSNGTENAGHPGQNG